MLSFDVLRQEVALKDADLRNIGKSRCGLPRLLLQLDPRDRRDGRTMVLAPAEDAIHADTTLHTIGPVPPPSP
jgi:cytidylate kinase